MGTTGQSEAQVQANEKDGGKEGKEVCMWETVVGSQCPWQQLDLVFSLLHTWHECKVTLTSSDTPS